MTWNRLVEDSVLDPDSGCLGLGLGGLDYNTAYVAAAVLHLSHTTQLYNLNKC